ncbi:MAG: PIN domain-containing protein [Desulfurococcales archaeon]|nr:PIN domain-containing protein [Desulfurococcales archaeon]
MSTSRKEVVFLDSSVILHYLTGDPRARDIIEDTSRLAVNSIVFSEVSFNLLKLLYSEKYGEYKFYNMKSRTTMLDKDILQGYTILQSFLNELHKEDRLVYLPITLEVMREASETAVKYGLLPNDALIAATCKHYGISTIATLDEDFERIPWLQIVPQHSKSTKRNA